MCRFPSVIHRFGALESVCSKGHYPSDHGQDKTVSVVISDDLDGSDGAETVTFGIDGVTYQIDLSPETGPSSTRHSLRILNEAAG